MFKRKRRRKRRRGRGKRRKMRRKRRRKRRSQSGIENAEISLTGQVHTARIRIVTWYCSTGPSSPS